MLVGRRAALEPADARREEGARAGRNAVVECEHLRDDVEVFVLSRGRVAGLEQQRLQLVVGAERREERLRVAGDRVEAEVAGVGLLAEDAVARLTLRVGEQRVDGVDRRQRLLDDVVERLGRPQWQLRPGRQQRRHELRRELLDLLRGGERLLRLRPEIGLLAHGQQLLRRDRHGGEGETREDLDGGALAGRGRRQVGLRQRRDELRRRRLDRRQLLRLLLAQALLLLVALQPVAVLLLEAVPLVEQQLLLPVERLLLLEQLLLPEGLLLLALVPLQLGDLLLEEQALLLQGERGEGGLLRRGQLEARRGREGHGAVLGGQLQRQRAGLVWPQRRRRQGRRQGELLNGLGARRLGHERVEQRDDVLRLALRVLLHRERRDERRLEDLHVVLADVLDVLAVLVVRGRLGGRRRRRGGRQRQLARRLVRGDLQLLVLHAVVDLVRLHAARERNGLDLNVAVAHRVRLVEADDDLVVLIFLGEGGGRLRRFHNDGVDHLVVFRFLREVFRAVGDVRVV